MITNAGTVAVYVEDQQKAKEFWTDKAGFEVAAERPMEPNTFWLEVAPKDAQTRLVLYPKAMMPNAENMKASIVFECDDILRTYEEMKAKGVKMIDEKPRYGAGGAKIAFCHPKSTNGVLIELSEREDQ